MSISFTTYTVKAQKRRDRSTQYGTVSVHLADGYAYSRVRECLRIVHKALVAR